MTILLSWCFTATETIRLKRDGFVTMSREGAAGQAGHRDRVERGFGNQVDEWGGKGEVRERQKVLAVSEACTLTTDFKPR